MQNYIFTGLFLLTLMTSGRADGLAIKSAMLAKALPFVYGLCTRSFSNTFPKRFICEPKSFFNEFGSILTESKNFGCGICEKGGASAVWVSSYSRYVHKRCYYDYIEPVESAVEKAAAEILSDRDMSLAHICIVDAVRAACGSPLSEYAEKHSLAALASVYDAVGMTALKGYADEQNVSKLPSTVHRTQKKFFYEDDLCFPAYRRCKRDNRPVAMVLGYEQVRYLYKNAAGEVLIGGYGSRTPCIKFFKNGGLCPGCPTHLYNSKDTLPCAEYKMDLKAPVAMPSSPSIMRILADLGYQKFAKKTDFAKKFGGTKMVPMEILKACIGAWNDYQCQGFPAMEDAENIYPGTIFDKFMANHPKEAITIRAKKAGWFKNCWNGVSEPKELLVALKQDQVEQFALEHRSHGKKC